MSDRLKRIIFGVFFFILVIGIGYGVYYVFFRPKTPVTPTTQTPTQNEGTLPKSGTAGNRPSASNGTDNEGLPSSEIIEGTTTPVTQQPSTILLKEGVVQQLTSSADGNSARYYDPVEGKFYKISADGLIKQLSDKTYSNVDTVTWGNTSDQAILSYPDGSKIHVNFETNTQETIPKHWEDFSFSTDDRKIVAKTLATSPESRYLVIADPSGKNTQAIEPLGENASKAHAAWTGNDQIVAYANVGEAIGLDREQIILVGKNHENYKSLLVEGRGFEPLWSPTGQWIAYSAWNLSNGYKPELWISGGAPGNLNDNRKKLNLQTWASKCAWNGDKYLYCAVPDSIQEGAGLQPDEYKYAGKDSIFKIDIESGAITNLGQPTGEPSIKNPTVTKNGESFIFTDAATGYLYNFRLP